MKYAEISKNLPAYTPALADPGIKDIEEPFLDGQKWNQVFFDGLADSVPAIQSVYDADIQPILDAGWTDYMAGKITAQEFLDSVDQQLAAMGIPLANPK